MSELFNIYCDESCHLEHDGQKVMVLGAVWCPAQKAREIAVRLREKKAAHGMPHGFEAKWGKVSPAKAQLYTDLLDYFFDDDDLHFRALVIPDKSMLNHGAFAQDHDTWYYKMMFRLLEPLFSPQNSYRIYLDQKDTRSASKVRKLHEALCNNVFDFDRKIINRVQVVRSHEVEQLQLADLLIGAIGSANRTLTKSLAKQGLVHRMRQRSSRTLTRTTLLREPKVNILVWEPRGSVL